MIIRVRSPNGTVRVEVAPENTIDDLRNKIRESWSTAFVLAKNPNGSDGVNEGTIASNGFGHGQMLYAIFAKGQVEETKDTGANTSQPDARLDIWRDPVDTYWNGTEGKIPRTRSKLCNHGHNAMCDYCSPLEPFNPVYLEEKGIKHLSFNAYARSLSKGTQGKLAFLDPPDFKVKSPCTTGHPPWPKGICSKCQPSAITLSRQKFRIVDHLEFEDSSLIDNFLGYWRSSGSQRFGYMYGYFAPYPEVPLGIKAVVCAIYEPPQEGSETEVEVGHVPGKEGSPPHAIAELKSVGSLAEACGLKLIGMIFTDLVDDGSKTGKVVCKRHIKSYYTSSLEALFSAKMQNELPNISDYAGKKIFGSKFVSCVLTGTEEGGIDIFAYQASNTCMAMTDADIVEASINPAVVRVREPSSTLYVPEVFYTYKNEYNTTVKMPAKPTFPVEYLLVTLSHGFPSEPNPKFLSRKPRFPIENRGLVESVNANSLADHLGKGELMTQLSDFHFLLYVKELAVMSPDDFRLLCEVAVTHDGDKANQLQSSPGWMQLLSLAHDAGYDDVMQTD